MAVEVVGVAMSAAAEEEEDGRRRGERKGAFRGVMRRRRLGSRSSMLVWLCFRRWGTRRVLIGEKMERRKESLLWMDVESATRKSMYLESST